jgi:chromosome segregation ATPase
MTKHTRILELETSEQVRRITSLNDDRHRVNRELEAANEIIECLEHASRTDKLTIKKQNRAMEHLGAKIEELTKSLEGWQAKMDKKDREHRALAAELQARASKLAKSLSTAETKVDEIEV